MENCLVTKLKGSVDNGELKFFNGIQIRFNAVAGQSYSINAKTKSQDLVSKAVLSGNATWSNDTKEIDIDYYGTIYGKGYTINVSADGEVIINIKDRDNISGFSTDGLGNKISKIELSDFNYSSIINLATAQIIVPSNLEDLKDAVNLSDYRCSYGFTEGNIEALGKLTKLASLNVGYYTKVTGEINTLAASQVANGRTSGTLAIVCNGKITLGGEVVPNATTKTITFSNGSYTVS